MSPKWTERFLERAKQVASWSKDPSTQVGAVIVRPDILKVVGEGYNGFPRGVHDHPDRYANRELKYSLVVHAEANAIIDAGRDAEGCTIFVWPLFTCNECAKLIIQSGIKKVVSPKPDSSRWASSYDTAMLMYEEAGIEVEWTE
jgi:dCMP deaminase